MISKIHDLLLWIHIPFGVVSLILFWLPISLRKGSALHRQYGRYYFYAMWVVLATSFLMSLCNLVMGRYPAAIYLGYLTILTAYPLWYSLEILQQKATWSLRYFLTRKIFLAILFLSGLGMILLGTLKFHFADMGVMMVFFGLVALPSGREILMSMDSAMKKEKRIRMHIRGTIISGIAAYTAFFAFGGSRILIDILHIHHRWMIIPWTVPTLLGLVYIAYMKRKYKITTST
ncbi:MAG: hypothetical protein KDC80_04155 [Saprospiraceae bacterium]|nr:hypothetical protein [Saprospiraceae bacterium]